MRNDERGYIAVEAIGAFILFLFLVLSILTLVNIVTLQSRVHYALTQAAETISMYSYVAEITGAAEHLMNPGGEAGVARKEAAAFKEDISGVLSGVRSFSLGDAGVRGEAAVSRVIDRGESLPDDPMEPIRLILDYGPDEARGALTEQLVRPLVGRYLSNGTVSGDAYLKSVNVIGGLGGLEFYDFSLLDPYSPGDDNSKILDANGNIKLVARYDIDYTFGALPLPFSKLSVTQTVKTKAWLNGSGGGYTVPVPAPPQAATWGTPWDKPMKPGQINKLEYALLSELAMNMPDDALDKKADGSEKTIRDVIENWKDSDDPWKKEMYRVISTNPNLMDLVISQDSMKKIGGLDFDIYTFKIDDTHAIVAFQGTQDFFDSINDVSQALGGTPPEAYVANAYIKHLGYENIYTTGHSLGGYLAADTAMNSDKVKETVTFDAPGRSILNPFDMWSKVFSDNANKITNYVAKGDNVHLSGFAPGPTIEVDVGSNPKTEGLFGAHAMVNHIRAYYGDYGLAADGSIKQPDARGRK